MLVFDTYIHRNNSSFDYFFVKDNSTLANGTVNVVWKANFRSLQTF